ncbi:MAG: hypothetical protein DSY42_00325 [Aquifex sp.]|nr:MAG: hypothetical protein DSY42_00325 [Aquifex sp.]
MAGKISEIFKEKDGKLSFGRTIGATLTFFYLGWATYLTWKTGQIVDIPSNLMYLIGMLYGANKLREAFNARSKS